MAKKTKNPDGTEIAPACGPEPYGRLVTGISGLLDEAGRMVVRSANHVIVSTYWEIGRRIVEFEQAGQARAIYGDELLRRLGRGPGLVPAQVAGRGILSRQPGSKPIPSAKGTATSVDAAPGREWD